MSEYERLKNELLEEGKLFEDPVFKADRFSINKTSGFVSNVKSWFNNWSVEWKRPTVGINGLL